MLVFFKGGGVWSVIVVIIPIRFLIIITKKLNGTANQTIRQISYSLLQFKSSFEKDRQQTLCLSVTYTCISIKCLKRFDIDFVFICMTLNDIFTQYGVSTSQAKSSCEMSEFQITNCKIRKIVLLEETCVYKYILIYINNNMYFKRPTSTRTCRCRLQVTSSRIFSC